MNKPEKEYFYDYIKVKMYLKEKYPKYKWQAFFYNWMSDNELNQNTIGCFNNEGLEDKLEDGYFDEKDVEMTNIVLDEFAEPAKLDANGYREVTLKVWW